MFAPNNSAPKHIHAKGVLAAPANTATDPKAAKKVRGNGMIQTNALPTLAPIKNKGVTSPPLNPAESVNAVKNILIAKT